MAEQGFTVVVLAAQRGGRLDPLAAEAGVTHKCLVPIGGRPLLAHVLAALSEVEGIESIRISVEPGADDSLRPIVAASGRPAQFVASADNIADSVYAAMMGTNGPVVITTADNVLLTPAAVRQIMDRLAGGDDAVVALARKEAVLAAHPQGQRRFYKFRDGEVSNCNLYGLSQRGLGLAETFREGGQFAKNPMRIARAFGFLNLLLLRFGLVSLDKAMKRLGKRFKVRASAVVLADGAHAIDVDNRRTYDIAAELLDRRAA
ncbi:MAG TPA: NTP transferase domain-containing protein [Allosphingosinicella sp.]|jgi:GTP:adenosylcobinamide-phosphate guanylyltransferase|nr:NTP transferase domain-containing protein [Allosphingosinicella sp.]